MVSKLTHQELWNWRFYQIAILATIIGTQVLSIVASWRIYDITHNPLHLGYAGLVQFVPVFFFSLLAGHTADQFNAKKILFFTQIGMIICSVVLYYLVLSECKSIWPILTILFVIGTIRAFDATTFTTFLTKLISEKHFPKGIAQIAIGKQMANILGPILGGFAYAASPNGNIAFLIPVLSSLVVIFVVWKIRISHTDVTVLQQKISLEILLVGIRHIYRNPIILNILTLDLFAVLFGGAVALLPIYAHDILDVGPRGLGILRSASGVGSLMTAFWIGFRPIKDKIGKKLLMGVFLFGVGTIVMAISRVFILTLIALVVIGAANTVSSVIRQTLVQLRTPPSIRGRVNAITQICNITSNQLGEFESGLTASWWGAPAAALFGGVTCCAIAGLWAVRYPNLRKIENYEIQPQSGAQVI